jgi:hypothetical protein
VTDHVDPATPPPLPADTPHRQVPQDIRDFVDGVTDEVVISPGRLFWAALPGGVRPDIRFAPGSRRGRVEIIVSLVGMGILEARVTAEVRYGLLHLDTSALPAVVPGLGDVRRAMDAWVQQLDTWLAHNDKELSDLRLRRGRLRLVAVARTNRVDLSSGRNRSIRPRNRGCRIPTGSLAAALAATSRRALRRPSMW